MAAVLEQNKMIERETVWLIKGEGTDIDVWTRHGVIMTKPDMFEAAEWANNEGYEIASNETE